MSEIAVGIDLGTSNSCVAIARGTKVEVLPSADGDRISASVVAFDDDGAITVGNRAKAAIIHQPENTISSAKRLIGRFFFSDEVKKAQAICAYDIVEGPNHSVRIEVRGEEFSLPEISAMVLREMKQIAERQLGQPVTKAVITVPAYFNDNQRQATKDAGKIAGLEVLRILNEPTAAALSYGFGRGLNQRVAVYDLGGGTFDVSVLEIGTDIFEVLSTCGDTFLGGDDFDDRIIDLLADEFVAKQGVNLRNDPYAFEKLKQAAENAKRDFSVKETVDVCIPDIIVDDEGNALTLERTITAAEFATLVNDLVMRTFKVCDEALQAADLNTRDLDGVILVGGPTRLPIIRQAVEGYFQQEIKADVDPDEVVAMGAAIHAASLVDPTQDTFLLDVTPLDLRMGVAGGLAEPIIERNTPVPIEQTRRFTTVQDYQDSVKIVVYQGDARQADQNEMLGQFEFSGFKRAKRGDVAIDVTFEINADGIVNVTAADPETGEKRSCRITLSSGLTTEEMGKIMARQGEIEDANVEAAPPVVGETSAPQADPILPVADEAFDAALDLGGKKAVAAPEPQVAEAAPAPAPAPAVAAPTSAPAVGEASEAALDDDFDAEDVELDIDIDVEDLAETEELATVEVATDHETDDLFDTSNTNLSEDPT